MRFLADMGISMSTVRFLLERGHDATHLRDEGLFRLEDSKIVVKARTEGRIVLTFDLDFGGIMASSPAAQPSVILFRLSNQTPSSVNPRLDALITASAEELAAGAFVTVDDQGYRLRTLPLLSGQRIRS